MPPGLRAALIPQTSAAGSGPFAAVLLRISGRHRLPSGDVEDPSGRLQLAEAGQVVVRLLHSIGHADLLTAADVPLRQVNI